MLRALGRAVVTVAAIAALFGAGAYYLGTQTDVFGDAMANALIDSGVLAGQLEDALRDNEERIAQELGMSVEQVDALVDDLDVGSWEAADVPAGIQPARTVSLNRAGTRVSATVYDDPSYVTVNAGGQEVTLHVSPAASELLRNLQ